jgi:hypothetical protein
MPWVFVLIIFIFIKFYIDFFFIKYATRFWGNIVEVEYVLFEGNIMEGLSSRQNYCTWLFFTVKSIYKLLNLIVLQTGTIGQIY